LDFGFRVQGSGFWIYGPGFRILIETSAVGKVPGAKEINRFSRGRGLAFGVNLNPNPWSTGTHQAIESRFWLHLTSGSMPSREAQTFPRHWVQGSGFRVQDSGFRV
jgi:hypothetical protein